MIEEGIHKIVQECVHLNGRGESVKAITYQRPTSTKASATNSWPQTKRNSSSPSIIFHIEARVSERNSAYVCVYVCVCIVYHPSNTICHPNIDNLRRAVPIAPAPFGPIVLDAANKICHFR